MQRPSRPPMHLILSGACLLQRSFHRKSLAMQHDNAPASGWWLGQSRWHHLTFVARPPLRPSDGQAAKVPRTDETRLRCLGLDQIEPQAADARWDRRAQALDHSVFWHLQICPLEVSSGPSSDDQPQEPLTLVSAQAPAFSLPSFARHRRQMRRSLRWESHIRQSTATVDLQQVRLVLQLTSIRRFARSTADFSLLRCIAFDVDQRGYKHD